MAEKWRMSGILELYKGENPTVDIIAIHGLNGDPIRSWTTDSGTCWLKDLLPSRIPNSRILTYGYNANVASLFGSTSSDRILQHAQTFVAELVADRELEGATQRPIIFICHSLGGIIAKRALVYSASRTSKAVAHIESIHVSTFALLFFGTPHDGGKRVSLALATRRIIDTFAPSKIIDSENQLLDALKPGSEVLQSITDSFAPLMKQYRVYFFWEQEKTNMGYTYDYAVAESSAAPILDNTERAGLAYDHRSMCKFENQSSPGYKLVVAALMRYTTEAPQVISSRWRNTLETMESRYVLEARELLG